MIVAEKCKTFGCRKTIHSQLDKLCEDCFNKEFEKVSKELMRVSKPLKPNW